MQPIHHLERYREFQQYVGWTDEDARLVCELAPLVEPDLHAIVDDFYEEIDRHPRARAVITGGESQVQRLKQTLVQWLRELFSGVYDDDYATRRWQVGWRHVEIGLDQAYPNVALARLRQGLVHAIISRWQGDPLVLERSLASLHRLIDLDHALITDAYQTESRLRLQRTERLATIGQVAGGIAHELRNPLNVVKTSVYYLLNARNPSPARVRDHLERIDRQVGTADNVISALSNFAKMPLPNAKPFALKELIHSVIDTLELSDTIEIEILIPPDLPMVLGDADQLAIVIANLIRNARDAMPNGGTLTLAAREEDEKFILLDVKDTGVGISEETLELITEPLYSTKARGLGLGLAISKAILMKNNGAISVASKLGEGSVFSVRLPSAPTENQPPPSTGKEAP